MQSRFEFKKSVGKGAFGEAFLCEEKATGADCIIKVIDISKMSASEQASTFQEVEILKKLSHPNIIKYMDSFKQAGQLCIVTEFAEGGDMHQKLCLNKAVPIAEDVILSWFVQLSLALAYTHKNKILHRDLKLRNIFLTKDNKIKLGDFGIARILKNTMELAHTVVGTPYYLSPEICENKAYNHKSDVWSLGCVLYEMCTRRHAFTGQSMTNLVMMILNGKYPALPSMYSKNIKDLVAVMLTTDPRGRPSVEQILKLPFLQPYIETTPQEQIVTKIAPPLKSKPLLAQKSETANPSTVEPLIPNDLQDQQETRAKKLRTKNILKNEEPVLIAPPSVPEIQGNKYDKVQKTEKFMLNGATLKLGSIGDDPLSYRIELLRSYLQKELGIERLFGLYRKVKLAENDDSGSEFDKDNDETFIPLILQLIFCENKAYSNASF